MTTETKHGIFTQKKIDKIESVVCEYNGETPERIKEKCRLRSIVLSRHIIFFLLRKHTLLTLNEIAHYYGLKDHSTVIHGIKALEDRMFSEPFLKKQVSQMSLLVKYSN